MGSAEWYQRNDKPHRLRSAPATEAPPNLAARGTKILKQAVATGDYQRLNEGVGLLEATRDTLDRRSPDRPGYLSNLVIALLVRFERYGRVEDLDEAIEVGRDAAGLIPQEHPDRARYLSKFANALRLRFQRHGGIEDLDEAIDAWRQAGASARREHSDSAGYLSNLATALRRRFELTGNKADLDESIEVGREVSGSMPREHPDRPMHLSGLAIAYLRRFKLLERVEDLDEAIALGRQAAGSVAANHPGRPGCLSNLASALQRRFELAGRSADLDEAIAVGRQPAGSVPVGHPDRPGYLSKLATLLWSRFELTGRRADLDEAIEAARAAAFSIPAEHPDRPEYLSRLCVALRRRFESYGQVQDLDDAVDVGREAARSAPGDGESRATYLFNYGSALFRRFERTGGEEDLDEAIEAGRQAAASIRREDPGRSTVLSNLGAALQTRFVRYGRLEDLDDAIEVGREAASSVPWENPNRPACLSNLSLALRHRFERYGLAEDLDEAIGAGREAADSIPWENPSRPAPLSNLAVALRQRFEHQGRIEDLDEAIQASREAVSSIPADHPDRCMHLDSLALALLCRFERHGRMEDLDQATKAGREAVSSIPEDHPCRPACLSNLAVALQRRFERYGQREEQEESVALFRLAAGVVSAAVHVRLSAAWEWGRAAVLAQHWAEAIEAFGATVDLAGLVASPELGRADQEHRLGWLSGLGPEAAAACLQAGRPDRAVELFEQGRAVLFSRVLDARSDLTGLQQAHPDLAERFVRWRDALEVPDPGPDGLLGEGGGPAGALRAAGDRRREAAGGLEQVLAEIRSRPGFDRFLLPRPVEELLEASEDGPVVLLNVTSLRSDALILTADGVEVLPLDGVGAEEVGRQVSAFLAALDTGSEAVLAGVLAWLGERVTGPVLDRLDYTTTPSAGMPWPRVWWCPSGALSLLPLHAAGRHEVSDGPPNAVIDRVISSTVPTVRALLQARQGTRPDGEPRVLVVAMPVTPGQADLPGVYREADILRKLYAERVDVLGLRGTDPADYDNVMAALPGYPLVHFACHGESDLSDPSSSHLLLADYRTRPLTVLDLTGARLQDAELAFLSACTTARTGAALPDEPIHLAAACQLAGYRHVIASLWPIGDTDTAWLTKYFYTIYSEDGSTADAALHQATRRLRLLYRDRPSRWAPYTHTGP